MIKKQFSFKSQERALFDGKKFVDRESARQAFNDFVTTDDKEYNVLMYYGIGGVGKSMLLAENEQSFQQLYAESILFSVDLHDASKRSIDSTLLEFVENCSNRRIKFEAFNLAYTLYFSKKHAGEEYDRNKSLVDNDFNLFFKILGVFDNGAIETVVDIIERIVNFAKKKSLREDVLEDLKQFDSLSLPEIEQRLPAYFHYDISRFISENPNTHILFSIDTFEALNVQQTEEIHRRKNEEWIQELIAYFNSGSIPNCRFVIYGRDKLVWEEDWESFVTQFELQDFSKEWTKHYLDSAGIKDNNIIKKIISNSKGHPFYLYLSAKTYTDICNQGKTPTIDDFGRNPKEIIRRFIYNLSDEEVNILKYLAVTNSFSYELFKYILSQFHIACDPERFKHIISYSFIHGLSGNEFYIHSLMRNGLKECTDEKSIALVNSVLFDYYSSEFHNKPNKNNFIELIYHAGRTQNPSEFSTWFEESDYISYLVSCQIKGEQELIFQVTEDLINQYGSKNLALRLINIYIDALHLGGDYQAAVATSKAYLDQYSLEETTSNESLCRMLIRKVHHSMFYLPADDLIDEVQQILSGHYVDNYPTQKNEILFLLGGNLGVLSGKFSYSKDILNRALSYANETQNTNNILRVTRKLADIETYEGKCKDAIERIEQYITADSSIDKRYDVYLMASLGEAYRKIGNLEVASKCFDKVLKASREKNIPGWIAHAELAMAMIDYDLKSYSKVIESTMLVEKAYASIHHEWGIINSQTLNMIADYNINGFTSHIASRVEDLIERSTKMNYRYNISILEEFKNSKIINYFQLFFL